MRALSLIPILVGLTLTPTAPVQAAPEAKSNTNSCFYSSQWQASRAINDRAFYVRVNMNDIYRIDLAQTCPELTDPDVRLDTVVRGSSLICGPLDWDLRVTENGAGGFSTACIVSAQTRLTKAEANAIPRKLRP